ncbi:MAG: LPS export ABC transporter periplasmic protein LptC [Alphaproteobacteria bacterium]|nr:LPS export ABC transporter periplasmic protein LptC [Alphaproteobacteria bacterium]
MLKSMKQNRRNFIIATKHKRWTRLWQFFFTGGGLAMIVMLAVGALFTRQLLWTPITAVNMTDIVSNQFKMSGASFAGTDKNGDPFKIRAKTGRQEYDNPDVIYMETVSGMITRRMNGEKTTNNVTARNAKYNRRTKRITLIGNVNIDSSNGDKMITNELVIKL